MMNWIRKNPFGDEDPLEIMIGCVAAEAKEQGKELTGEDVALLRAEYYVVDPENDTKVDRSAELRYMALVKAVLEKEAASETGSKRFTNAIEWAGDQQYPYVVALAELCITGEDPGPRVRRGRLADQFFLLATGLAVVLAMFLIVTIVGILSEKR
jgi:hypothetical protein